MPPRSGPPASTLEICRWLQVLRNPVPRTHRDATISGRKHPLARPQSSRVGSRSKAGPRGLGRPPHSRVAGTDLDTRLCVQLVLGGHPSSPRTRGRWQSVQDKRDSRAPGPGQLQAMASLNQKPSPPLRGLFLMTQPRRPEVPTGSGATAGSPRLGQEGPNFPDNRKVQVEMPLKTGPFQCGGAGEGWSTPEVCEAARPGRSEGHKRPKKQS